jgi:hypothetical protein
LKALNAIFEQRSRGLRQNKLGEQAEALKRPATPEIDRTDMGSRTKLYIAASDGDEARVGQLLDAGADLHKQLV